MKCSICKTDTGDFYVRVCDRCRADAALGRAVRKMPEGFALFHSRENSYLEGRWLLSRESPSNLRGKTEGDGKELEAALRAAGLMEGDEG